MPHQLQLSCVLMMVLCLLPGNAPRMAVQLPRPAGWSAPVTSRMQYPKAQEQLAQQPHHAGAPGLAHKAASRTCCCAEHRTTKELKTCVRCTWACLRAGRAQGSPVIHDSPFGAGQLLLADLLAGRRSEADPPVGTVILQTAEGPSVSRSQGHGLQPAFAVDAGISLKRPKLHATVVSRAQTQPQLPFYHTPGVTCGARLNMGHRGRPNPSRLTHLHKDVAEGDAAQQGPLVPVVKHAEAVGPWLVHVHEQVVEGAHLQRLALQQG